MTPDRCPHCGDDRQLEPIQGSAFWLCNTCARTFDPVPVRWVTKVAYDRLINPEERED